jgi:hypothetical protein
MDDTARTLELAALVSRGKGFYEEHPKAIKAAALLLVCLFLVMLVVFVAWLVK